MCDVNTHHLGEFDVVLLSIATLPSQWSQRDPGSHLGGEKNHLIMSYNISMLPLIIGLC